LLDFLPPPPRLCNQSVRFVRNGQTFVVPVGSLTGSQASTYDDGRRPLRIDHRFNDKHTLNGTLSLPGFRWLGSIPVWPRHRSRRQDFHQSFPARTQGVNLQLHQRALAEVDQRIARRFSAQRERDDRARSAF
jgi:hypothetical protein